MAATILVRQDPEHYLRYHEPARPSGLQESRPRLQARAGCYLMPSAAHSLVQYFLPPVGYDVRCLSCKDKSLHFQILLTRCFN